MSQKKAIVWGAGRIGRGLVADLFHAGGYQLTLVDCAPKLIEQLRAAGQYTVVGYESASRRVERVIDGYVALTTEQTDELAAAITATDVVAIAVFAQDFPAVAQQLARYIMTRRAKRPEDPLDILLCANLLRAGPKFRTFLFEALPAEAHPYAEQHVGVVETVVMRAAVDMPADAREKAPLEVWTDGYEDLPADRRAFKGEIPHIPGLRPVDDIYAEGMRKLYAANMFHAALAYLGALRGYTRSVESLADPWIRNEAEGALREASLALQVEHGFSADEMNAWNKKLLDRIDNPSLGDTIVRNGADPRRKLRRSERLLGPALLARQHHIRPTHLAKVIAAGLLYDNSADPSAVYIQGCIAELGLSTAVREVCELNEDEDDLAAMIVEAYRELNERTAGS